VARICAIIDFTCKLRANIVLPALQSPNTPLISFLIFELMQSPRTIAPSSAELLNSAFTPILCVDTHLFTEPKSY
jgi:hypothetical protein